MIYITGDTHNLIDMHNASSKQYRKYCGLQNVDYHDITYMIILGDFGLPWYDCEVDEKGIHPENKEDRYLLKWYNQKPFKVLAVMGNHDNYNMLEKLPEVEMFGNKVLKLSDNIFYLKRGHYYEIEGKTFLVLGGAHSSDKQYRIANFSWWPQEEWSVPEMMECLKRIDEHNGKADYVLSHTGPAEGIMCLPEMQKLPEVFRSVLDHVVRFNDEVNSKLEYKKWFFGHWHSDWGFEHREDSKYIPLYHEGVIIDCLK